MQLFRLLGLLCDLLWSDPNKDKYGWNVNDRGVSYTFGADVVTKFLEKHDFDLICRGHQVIVSPHACTSVVFDKLQVIEDGYEFFAKRQLITIFSAPNYCGEFDNAGALMSVNEDLLCSFQVGINFNEEINKDESLISLNVLLYVSFRFYSQKIRKPVFDEENCSSGRSMYLLGCDIHFAINPVDLLNILHQAIPHILENSRVLHYVLFCV